MDYVISSTKLVPTVHKEKFLFLTKDHKINENREWISDDCKYKLNAYVLLLNFKIYTKVFTYFSLQNINKYDFI